MEEAVAREIPELISLLAEIPSKVTKVVQHTHTLKQHVSTDEFTTEKGISLLEVKYHLLLSYVINLVELMLHKTQGKKIMQDPCVDRLVEIRTVLEKIRPLDQKLRYQIDKLIKTANTGLTAAADPLRFKPNPHNLISKLPDTTERGGIEKESSGVYIPPRVHAMPYDEDDEINHKRKTKQIGIKKGLVEELQQEFSDSPHEVKDFSHELTMKRRVMEEVKEREQYEEEYFVRLNTSRKTRLKGRQMTGSLEEALALENEVKTCKRARFKQSFKRKRLKGAKRRKLRH